MGRTKAQQYCSHLETASTAPLPASEYIGSLSSPDTGAEEAAAGQSNPIALSYADQRRCPHNLNLIAVFGDRTPRNDVDLLRQRVLRHPGRRHRPPEDRRQDRQPASTSSTASAPTGPAGVYLRNMTFQQAEFNSIYVLETDGFVVDRVTARGNDEYGILAFASDHGLIQRSEAYFNGDSGIYPGSGSDLNADNPNFEATRYAIEIRHNSSHDNTLGYSGTAGNSIWAHDNKFFHNATGIATDSLFPGHPGLPQDHARWSHNRIFSNNTNYYTKYVDTGVCAEADGGARLHRRHGLPGRPDPGRHGRADRRRQLRLHRPQLDLRQLALRHHAVLGPGRAARRVRPRRRTTPRTTTTRPTTTMGITPDGSVAHNGVDHWWDDQGDGNCWQDNTYSRGEQTDNFTVAAAVLRRRRVGLHPGRAGQGRGLPRPAASTTAATRPGGTPPAASGSTARRARGAAEVRGAAVDSDGDDLVAARSR